MLCPLLWYRMFIFCLCSHIPNCQICAPAVSQVATVYWRVEELRKERMRQRLGRTGDVALCQINVITALIRQLFNLKGAKGGWGAKGKRGIQEGREEKESFGCIQMSVCVALTTSSSPPPSFHWLWWSPRLLCVWGYLKVTHLKEIPGYHWASSYRTQQKQLHLNPKGLAQRWNDVSFTPVLLLTFITVWREPVALG